MEAFLRSVSSGTSEEAINSLLQALTSEKVFLPEILFIAFSDANACQNFVSKYTLPMDAEILLSVAVASCSGLSNAFAQNALDDTKRRLAEQPSVLATPKPGANSAKVQKLEKAHNRLALGQAPPAKFGLEFIKPTSLKEINERRTEKVTKACNELFHMVGNFSPRYSKVCRQDLSEEVRNQFMEAMVDSYFATAKPPTVAGYCRSCLGFLEWLKPVCSLDEVSPFEIMAFLRDSRPKGVHVPGQKRCALMWFESVFDLRLYTKDRLVMAQCASKRSSVPRDSPIKAQCPSVDLIITLEQYVGNQFEPPVPRIIAGLLLAMTHGVLRWSDIQRSLSLELGRDMLTAKATMKRKDILTPWVAARRGFSGTDWAESWLCLLAAFGMPGPDFVLLEPTGLESFAQKPATYFKVIIYMRICIIRCGMSASEAVLFTLHGWRQLMPTMANQLGLPELEQEAIGHWRKGSAMPQHYDALHCSLETRAKDRILTAMKGGFRPGKKGEFFADISTFTPPPKDFSPKKAKPEARLTNPVSIKPVVEYVDTAPLSGRIGTSFRLVRNTDNQKLHVHSIGNVTVSGDWACGCPETPSVNADFCGPLGSVDLVKDFENVCSRCFSEKMTARFSSVVKVPCHSYLKDRVFGPAADSSSDEGSDIATPVSTDNEGDGS